MRPTYYTYFDNHGFVGFKRKRIPLDPKENDGRTKKIVYVGYDRTYEGHRDLIYRLPQVLKGIKDGLAVWWTEGEKDADTLADEHDLIATSHHGGAGKVSPEQARWLRGASRVFVLMDNDPPGQADALLRHNLLVDAAGLSPEQVIVLRARRPHKDVTDHLDAGYTTRQLIRVDVAELRRDAALTTALDFRQHGYRWRR